MEKGKKLTLFGTIVILVSGMMGSAIFSLSGLTISYAGPSAILSWIIAAVIQLLYGLSMAELATVYKKNGGTFSFPERTFEKNGRLLGFISTWGNTFADVVSIAFSATYVSIYLSSSFTFLSKYSLVITIVTIILCLLVNYLNINSTGKFNFILGIFLILTLLLYSVLIFVSGNFDDGNFVPFFAQGTMKEFGFIKAIPIAMIGYSSIMSVSYMVEEVDNPQKNLPKAVFIGMGLVVIIYVLTIFTTLGSITASELDNLSMTYIPLFAACMNKLMSYPFILYVISIAAVFALITTITVVIAINGRAVKACADKGLLPKQFSYVGKNGSPIVSMTTSCIIAIILTLFPKIMEILVNLGALFAIITILINLISMLSTRINKAYLYTENNNFYKAPINNIFIIVLILVMISCYIPDIIKGGSLIFIVTFIWLLLGIIIFNIFKRA